jgi:hypothetical protein
VKWEQLLPFAADRGRNAADGTPIRVLSDEWFRARLGRITASVRAHTIAQGREFEWDRLRAELRAEMQPDYHSEPFSNEATRWGQDHEAEAIANIELETGLTLWEPGFVFHQELDYAGASPDFFAEDHISGQIKCPFNPKYHLETVHGARVPTKYFHQVQFEAYISRRPRILFASYDPRQPLATRLAIVWMEADPLLHEMFDMRLREFYDFFHSTSVVGKLTGIDGIPNIFPRRKA